jgi:hypothetical protein
MKLSSLWYFGRKITSNLRAEHAISRFDATFTKSGWVYMSRRQQQSVLPTGHWKLLVPSPPAVFAFFCPEICSPHAINTFRLCHCRTIVFPHRYGSQIKPAELQRCFTSYTISFTISLITLSILCVLQIYDAMLFNPMLSTGWQNRILYVLLASCY